MIARNSGVDFTHAHNGATGVPSARGLQPLLNSAGPITLDHLAFYRAAFLCCRPRARTRCTDAMATNFADITLNSTYGGPEDYAAAIEELRAALPGDAVSVEPTVLEKHGKSIGELKTGMYRLLVRPCIPMLTRTL